MKQLDHLWNKNISVETMLRLNDCMDCIYEMQDVCTGASLKISESIFISQCYSGGMHTGIL